MTLRKVLTTVLGIIGFVITGSLYGILNACMYTDLFEMCVRNLEW